MKVTLAALALLGYVDAGKVETANFQQGYLDFKEVTEEQDANLASLRESLEAERVEKGVNVKMRKKGMEQAKVELAHTEELLAKETRDLATAKQQYQDHLAEMTHKIGVQCKADHAARLTYIKAKFPNMKGERAVRAKHVKLEELMGEGDPFDPVWDTTRGRCVNDADYEPHPNLVTQSTTTDMAACTAACLADTTCVAHSFGLNNCLLYKKAAGEYQGDKFAHAGYHCKAHRTRDTGHSGSMLALLEELEMFLV